LRRGGVYEYGAMNRNTAMFEITMVSIRAPREIFSWVLA
jgi:hypothetical protein